MNLENLNQEQLKNLLSMGLIAIGAIIAIFGHRLTNKTPYPDVKKDFPPTALGLVLMTTGFALSN